MRWRIEQEVVTGKGQFICGNKRCDEKEELRSWEVNFTYVEQSEKKNALVKLRLCVDCSKKLNYHSTKRLVKKQKRLKSKVAKDRSDPPPGSSKNTKEVVEVNDSNPEDPSEVVEESTDPVNRQLMGNEWSKQGNSQIINYSFVLKQSSIYFQLSPRSEVERRNLGTSLRISCYKRYVFTFILYRTSILFITKMYLNVEIVRFHSKSGGNHLCVDPISEGCHIHVHSRSVLLASDSPRNDSSLHMSIVSSNWTRQRSSSVTLACVYSGFPSRTNERRVQAEPSSQSGALKSVLAHARVHNWQLHSFHYHTVFALLSKHVLSPTRGNAVVSRGDHTLWRQANRIYVVIHHQRCV